MQAEFFEHEGVRLALRFLPGAPPTVVYLPGFRSDIEGRKARRVEAVCRAAGLACLRFDHRGHGASGGRLADGSIGVWFRDARALLSARTEGDLVLVGASMGVWLMLLLARAFASGGERGGAPRVRGMVGIGGAADFTDRLCARLSPDEREALRQGGVAWRPSRYGDGPYPLTVRMVEDGRRHRVLDRPWNPGCPVHLLHGMRDPDVPWTESLAIAGALRGAAPVRVTLTPDGDHRLSRAPDLDRLERALRGVAEAARRPRASPLRPAAIEPLDARRIRTALPHGAPRLGGIAVHRAVGSTNTWLLERAATLPSPYVCVSEHQTAGRGRRGRTWHDGAGRDLCLSLLWRFEDASAPRRSQGLSLAAGVAAVRALEAMGARGVGLKWPNDVVWRDRKLGGILIESSIAGRSWTVVIGMGINFHAGAGTEPGPESGSEPAPEAGPPRVHLEAVSRVRGSRNDLAACLVAELAAECARFEAEGAGPAVREWEGYDVMRGRPVTVATASGEEAGGIARGVDAAGELLVEVDGGRVERFVSAEVSVRAARPEPEAAA